MIQLLCLCPSLPSSVKLNLEDAERDRDSLKFKLAERKRELERVREQVKVGVAMGVVIAALVWENQFAHVAIW